MIGRTLANTHNTETENHHKEQNKELQPQPEAEEPDILKRYIYNNENQKWEPREFKALPTNWFTWWTKDTQEDERNHRRTNFILDTGSKINLMNQREAETKGINMNTLKKDKTMGATGGKRMDWRQLSVHITRSKR